MHIYLTILYVNIDLSTNTYIFIFITEMNAYIYKLFSVFLYMYVCMYVCFFFYDYAGLEENF